MSDRQPVPELPEDTGNDDDAVIDPLKTALGQTLYASDPPPTSSALPPPLPAHKKRFRWGRTAR